MRVAARITLSEEQRATLESWSRGRKTPARLVLRSKIVLHAADELENQEIAIKLGTDRESVGRWRSRFAKLGLAGIEKDAPRSGRKPGLPIKKGRCGTMTHDYKRNGTTTLFAAIELLSGTVIGECMPRHRHQEWIKFLRAIDEQTPAHLALHLIVDNYATHKHPKVQAWLRRHPRFHIHFTPTSTSWLNLIERFFRDLTEREIRRGTFLNVEALIDVITSYIGHHNSEPKSFKWTATADQIMEKVTRAKLRLQKTASE